MHKTRSSDAKRRVADFHWSPYYSCEQVGAYGRRGHQVFWGRKECQVPLHRLLHLQTTQECHHGRRYDWCLGRDAGLSLASLEDVDSSLSRKETRIQRLHQIFVAMLDRAEASTSQLGPGSGSLGDQSTITTLET